MSDNAPGMPKMETLPCTSKVLKKVLRDAKFGTANVD